ncbi:MAG: DUF4097 family beta strand repeat-containing protein [Candidatus Acidiferrales bacterium]
MRRFALVALAVMFLAFAGSARADNWSKTFAISGRGHLLFSTQDGEIDLAGTSEKQISVTVDTIGRRISPDDVTIEEHQTGDSVNIEIRVPRDRHHFISFDTGRRSIHVTIHVPIESDIDVHSGDGRISAANVNGQSRLDSGDGSIHADHFHGNVRLHSGDGRIEGFDFDGTLYADSGDGHITVRGRFDRLDLHSGDGTIEATAENNSHMTGPWTVRTGDGHIYMRLPENFAATLDAHTGDGHVTVGYPVTVSGTLDSGTIRGKMAGGGETLMLRSGDGSISIDRL